MVYAAGDANTTKAYAYSCPLTSSGTAQTLPITIGSNMQLMGGDGAQRNAYYNLTTAGINFIVVNLRTMEVRFDKK